MAVPSHIPQAVTAPRVYRSPPRRPEPWTARRPGELVGVDADADARGGGSGRLGCQGPDQGYALRLAQRFADAVVVESGESVDDVLAGCCAVALRRASLFGRAPVVHDLRLALELFGFLVEEDSDERSGDLNAWRREKFAGASSRHGYTVRRRLAESVPESALCMTPQEAAEARDDDWRRLIGA